MTLNNLSYWAREAGRINDALAMIADAYRINLDLGQRIEVVADLSRFARALAAANRHEASGRLLGRSLAAAAELGVDRAYEHERDEETLAILRGTMDSAALNAGLAAGREMTTEDAVVLAMTSTGI